MLQDFFFSLLYTQHFSIFKFQKMFVCSSSYINAGYVNLRRMSVIIMCYSYASGSQIIFIRAYLFMFLLECWCCCCWYFDLCQMWFITGNKRYGRCPLGIIIYKYHNDEWWFFLLVRWLSSWLLLNKQTNK